MPKKKAKPSTEYIRAIDELIEYFQELNTAPTAVFQQAIERLKEMKNETTITPWNIQNYLKTPKNIANYLESALEENDAEFTVIAVEDAIAALRNLKKEEK